MSSAITNLSEFFRGAFASMGTDFDWEKMLYGALFFIAGFLLLRIVIFIIVRFLRKRISEQGVMLARKVMSYSGITLILIVTLNQMGVSIGALLGAAGIAGIAIGFAAQASISSLISGLFLISEKSFEVGDLVRVGAITGIVVDIELLAVKLRTFDNRYVRIPNEIIIKTELQNITHYPIRRIDLPFTVEYGSDLRLAEKVLRITAKNNPYCLDEPEPLLLMGEFSDAGVSLKFGVWCIKDDYVDLKNSIMTDIHEAFDAAGIVFAVRQIRLRDGRAEQSAE